MGKILRKAIKKLQRRRNQHIMYPNLTNDERTKQDHGMNNKGNMAKQPGSMKK